MWTKVWLIAGLESQLKKAGDFITCEIGPESILCTKDKSGKIRAFYNVCQHRGNILMHEAINLEEDVSHQVGKVGEVSTGPVIDQDVSIWNTQQKGLKSRGYKGDYLPAQENRVRFFHENVDRYLAAKD